MCIRYDIGVYRLQTASGLLIYTGAAHSGVIAMQFSEKRRKGQSAIEYLTTYGWAILIIGVVIAFLASQGVFSQCSKTQPRFSGQAASIDTWAFNGTNSIAMTVEATNQDIDLEHIKLDYDRDGTWDNTVPATGAYDISLSPGGSGATIAVGTGTQFSSGECAKMDIGINATITDLSTTTVVTGEGILQSTVP